MTGAEELYDAIVAERGGTERLGVTGCAVARALAQCLATNSPSAAVIQALSEMLPARIVAAGV
jgi:hypothetical protein